MHPTLQLDRSSPYPTGIRAEDGNQPSQWSVLCEGVLIPLGSLFAILLCMMAVMVLSR